MQRILVLFYSALRWQFNPRWRVLGFYGLGHTETSHKFSNVSQDKSAWGGGFSYYLSRMFGIHAGIDIARGPEDTAWYITIGNAWMR